jgi:hypothetical protein
MRELRASDVDALRQFKPLSFRLEEAFVSLLEAYRDSRWTLMIELAKRSSADAGRTFARPEQIRRYAAARRA